MGMDQKGGGGGGSISPVYLAHGALTSYYCACCVLSQPHRILTFQNPFVVYRMCFANGELHACGTLQGYSKRCVYVDSCGGNGFEVWPLRPCYVQSCKCCTRWKKLAALWAEFCTEFMGVWLIYINMQGESRANEAEFKLKPGDHEADSINGSYKINIWLACRACELTFKLNIGSWA